MTNTSGTSNPIPAADPQIADAKQPTVITRRLRSEGKMSPRQVVTDEKQVIVSRGVMETRRDVKAQTSRDRLVAGDLPDWEPMPPGELRVSRTSRGVS